MKSNDILVACFNPSMWELNENGEGVLKSDKNAICIGDSDCVCGICESGIAYRLLHPDEKWPPFKIQ